MDILTIPLVLSAILLAFLLRKQIVMSEQKIYKVTTEGDVEGRTQQTLGYATGNPNDIREYFNNQKYYGIYLTELPEPIHVTHQLIVDHMKLIEEKNQIEQRLEAINKQLKHN